MSCNCDMNERDCVAAGHCGSKAKFGQMLEDAKAKGLINFRPTFSPEVGNLSKEEIYASMVEVMESIEKWNALTDEQKMREQIKQAYEALNQVIGLCKTNLRTMDFNDPRAKEDSARRSKIFCGIESAMMFLGNWIPQEKMTAIRKSRPENQAV